jgi:lysine biosynthesis protein LysW
MPKAYCPNCDAIISVEQPRIGTMVKCRKCDIELEIVSTRPFEVDFPLDYDDLGDEEEQ